MIRTLISLKTLTLGSLLMTALVACGGGDDGASGDGDGDGAGDGDTGDGDLGDGDLGDGDGDEGTGGTPGDGDGDPAYPCGRPLIDLTASDVSFEAGELIADGEWSGYMRAMEPRGEDLFVLADDGLFVVYAGTTTRELITTELPEFPVFRLTDGSGYLRVSDTHAYLATASGLARIELSTGVLEEIYSGLQDGELTSELILVDEDIYFGIYDIGIFKVPQDGSSQPELVTDELEFLGMAIANGNIYGGNQNDNLAAVPLTGGAATPLTDLTGGVFPSIDEVNVVGETLYWNDSGGVLACTLPTCDDARALGISAGDDFYVRGDRIYRAVESVSWNSLVDSSCGILVGGDWPDTFDAHAVTESYLYIGGELAGFGGGQKLFRVRLDAQ